MGRLWQKFCQRTTAVVREFEYIDQESARLQKVRTALSIVTEEEVGEMLDTLQQRWASIESTTRDNITLNMRLQIRQIVALMRHDDMPRSNTYREAIVQRLIEAVVSSADKTRSGRVA